MIPEKPEIDEPKPDLDRLIALAIGQAESVLLNQPKASIVPTFLMEKEDGEVAIFGTPWGTEQHKDITVFALRHIMRIEGVIRYSFISEAWMAKAPTDFDPRTERLPHHQMPSQDPERVEVVIITASDKETAKSILLRIVRGEGGTVVRLDPDRASAKHVKGRFADLLHDEQS